jgi:hypothetical protein
LSICDSATPAMPAMPGAEAEGQRIDARGGDAHRGRHAAVLSDRAHLEPERGVAQHGEQDANTASVKAEDPEPVIGDGDLPEFERAAHPGGIADLAVGRAEHGAHGLLQHQREAPGREQRFQRAAVEKADDAALDQHAEGAGDEERQRHRDQQRIVEQAGIAGADDLLHHEGDVGADHHHLAMGHVDDAHDAEGDGKPDRGEQQHRAQRQAVPGVLHHRPHREVALDRGDRLRPRRARHWAARRCRGPVSSAIASWSPFALTTATASSFSTSVASGL